MALVPCRALSLRRPGAGGEVEDVFFPSRQIDWMTLDLPKRTKLKRRRWAKPNERRIIFRWVILGHKISDWSIHPVFPFRLNEEHVPCGHFFSLPRLYFSARFHFSGCFINFPVFTPPNGSDQKQISLKLTRSNFCSSYFLTFLQFSVLHTTNELN